MICLSKADENAFRHLSWNQSPSPMAAESTTRQDLNGISNLREHVEGGQEDGTGLGGCGGGLFGGDGDKQNRLRCQPPGLHRRSDADTGLWSRCAGLSSCLKTVVGGDDHNRLIPRGFSSSRLSRVWSWTAWVLSVLVVSSLLSSWNSPPPAPATQPQPSVHVASSPLRRRASTCDSGGVDKNAYNTPLHVGALFIIWFVSTIACAFPILATKVPGLKIPVRFFFIVRHFGTGVLIATAFVHLLPTAFISLGDPCLSSFWNTDYPAMPGAISLAAIFFVIVIEMIFHPSRHIPPPQTAQAGHQHAGGCMGNLALLPVNDKGPYRGRATSIGQGLTNITSRDDRERDETSGDDAENARPRRKEVLDTASPESSHHQLSAEQQQRKELLQCVLLELGILFHSVFIGMALSVTIGNEFIILLIAIAFHQTFEGLALGSRIAAVKWPQGKKQPWFMALAYGFTTPLGQAIGLATHTLYTPTSEVGLILVGVMNAISAGLLTYASLVELLSEDFLSDESWRVLRGKKRICACLLVFAGAFLMSLVGAWA